MIMEEFMIRCRNAEDASKTMQRYAETIRDLKEQVTSVRMALTSNIYAPSIMAAAQKLRVIENKIIEDAAHMNSLSSVLEYVISAYQITEQRILHKWTGNIAEDTKRLNELYEKIQDIAEDVSTWFRSIMVSIGIIKAEKPQITEGEAITQYQEKEMDRYMQNQIAAIRKESRFTEKHWKSASLDERKSILSDYMQRVSQVMGISVSGLTFISVESQNGYVTRGSYNDLTNYVMINEWVIENSDDSYDLINTISHELRHAYQYTVCQNPENFIVSQETIALWQESFDNYKSSSGFEAEGMSTSEAYKAYRNQAVEKDARKFAKQN